MDKHTYDETYDKLVQFVARSRQYEEEGRYGSRTDAGDWELVSFGKKYGDSVGGGRAGAVETRREGSTRRRAGTVAAPSLIIGN